MKNLAANSFAFRPVAAGLAENTVPPDRDAAAPSAAGPHSRHAFSLIEIMVVVALLTLIMVALMSVFSSTQTAFRASITQTDILEGGRAAMDLMTGDIRQMTPSGGYNATLHNVPDPVASVIPPSVFDYPLAPINFWLSAPVPTIIQPLIGASTQQMRTNQLQSVFLLTYQNQLWHGVGYFVDTNSSTYIYPLYRYDSNLEIAMTNLPARPSPEQIFTNFCSVAGTLPNLDPATNATRLLDGVVHFNVRAYDQNGAWLTNNFANFGSGSQFVVTNATFYRPVGGEVALFMCSNTLPASVEIQMGVLEDRNLQRASTFPAQSLAQSNYLAQQVGKVHVFRQRVTVPNFDPKSYQP